MTKENLQVSEFEFYVVRNLLEKLISSGEKGIEINQKNAAEFTQTCKYLLSWFEHLQEHMWNPDGTNNGKPNFEELLQSCAMIIGKYLETGFVDTSGLSKESEK
jgi:hypothetical protein